MDLPEDFGPEREELLEQWQRIRDLEPAVVIPGTTRPSSSAHPGPVAFKVGIQP